MKTATAKLEAAKNIDPTDAAVLFYLDKLAGGNPRFLVELEKQAPTYNPALLGFITKGSVYLWLSMSVPWETNHKGGFPTGNSRYLVKETAVNQHPGIMIPVGKNLGLMCDMLLGGNLRIPGFGRTLAGRHRLALPERRPFRRSGARLVQPERSLL
ncbi:MAG: hypothetical protein NT080_09040 [Spirochaetes bacterium]|nr:hypothetical protein [Spirochaetota bacterium]